MTGRDGSSRRLKLVYDLAWDSSGLLGTPMQIVSVPVIAFTLFSQVLSHTRVC